MPHPKNTVHWLVTPYLNNIGPIRLRRWLTHFGNIESLFTATQKELQSANIHPAHIRSLKNPNWKAAEEDLIWCENHNITLLAITDDDYPVLLKEIPDAPLILFVQGDASLLQKPQLAIVGSRNPSIMGIEQAEQFSYYLAQAGLVITSGLALGIDAAGHQGALEAGGKTIAVLGTGLKHIYPASHRKLAQAISTAGALVTEFAPHTPPIAKHFPMRNRIISGLSTGVLVVEAAIRSGSLITAHCAIEQGREVFALPGSIHNPLARGCHQLIRQGAKLVETANDILEELGALASVTQTKALPTHLDEKSQRILAQIGYESTALDAIIMRSGLTTMEVSSMLLSLELEGYVKKVLNGYVRLTNLV